MANMASKTRRIFTSRDGIQLIADEVGPADGPIVLFLHGGGQTRASWGQAVENLGRAGYRAITLDARGHGESDWSPGGVYEPQMFAQDLGDVLQQLPSGAALVGASMGGMAALAALGNGLDNGARALVLVDIVPRLQSDGGEEIFTFMTSNPDGFATVEEAADAVAAYLPHRPRPKDASGLKRNLRQRDNGRYYWHWDPAMFGGRKMSGTEEHQRVLEDYSLALEEAARKIRIPTLLIRGARSRVVSEEGAAEFRQLMPHAEYVSIADAHHMVAGDANDAFAVPLIDFFARHLPAERATGASTAA